MAFRAKWGDARITVGHVKARLETARTFMLDEKEWKEKET